MNVDVVIPALDEERAIGDVVTGLLRQRVRSVVVVDNGSRDRTASVAESSGARVVREGRRGYGAACLAGLAALSDDCDIVVFADGDGSDDAEDLRALTAPIEAGSADLVVGSRTLGQVDPGALTPQQRIGNALATAWLRLRFGLPATDLGPFRAVRRQALGGLHMSDRGYGWTVEMQIKAARQGLRYAEVPVHYRRRVGQSKISGTVRGTVGAGAKILGLLAWHDAISPAFERTRQPTRP